jgi:Rrf2 family cysteine metabolism transcriptional repressor
MKISTKGRYATRALVELAMRAESHPVRLKEIANCQNLSVKYLENLFRTLKQAQLVKGTVGMRGGYVLSRSPEDLTVLDILEAVEGEFFLVECVRDTGCCEYAAECVTHSLWKKINVIIRQELSSITLKSLAEKNKKLWDVISD